uniref:Uncharacterized protein n=1 Tax=Aegilops tauschii subsp. strangulata TaxID=200361 RepID=A0A452YB91_AEGTS
PLGRASIELDDGDRVTRRAARGRSRSRSGRAAASRSVLEGAARGAGAAGGIVAAEHAGL